MTMETRELSWKSQEQLPLYDGFLLIIDASSEFFRRQQKVRSNLKAFVPYPLFDKFHHCISAD
jgi:hypothetical protein